MFPDLTPLIYFATVPAGGFVGSLVGFGMIAAGVRVWPWPVVAIGAGLVAGKLLGDRMK